MQELSLLSVKPNLINDEQKHLVQKNDLLKDNLNTIMV